MRWQPNFMSTYLPWVNAFNQEKALVGDFQEIVKFCEVSFAALGDRALEAKPPPPTRSPALLVSAAC